VRLAEILSAAGCYQNVVGSLLHDPWVTLDRTERWIADLRTQTKKPEHGIRSLAAVLASNLKEHREPPESKARWARFLCSFCGELPCICS
jgi:hypothetical protein